MKETINRTRTDGTGDDREVNDMPLEEAERSEDDETFSVLVMNEKEQGHSSSRPADNDKEKEPVITDDHMSLKLSDSKIKELGEDAAQLVGRRALELEREEQELLAIFKEKKDALKRQEEEKLLSKLRELEESTDGMMKRHREEFRLGTDAGREKLRRGEEEKLRLEDEEKEARAAGHKEDEEKIRLRLAEIEALEREAAEVTGKKEYQLREKEAGMQASFDEERERLKREEELEFRQKLDEMEEETSALMQQREREFRRAFGAEAEGLKRGEKEKLDEEISMLAQRNEEALKKNEAEMRASRERGRLVREVQEKIEEEKKKLVLKEQEEAARMSRQKDEELEKERMRLRIEDEEKLKSKLDELSRQNESESQKKDDETRRKLYEERERMKREEEALRQKEEELRKKELEMRASIGQDGERLRRESEEALKKKFDEILAQKEDEFKKKELEMRLAFEGERTNIKREGLDDRRAEMEKAGKEREQKIKEKHDEEERTKHFFLKSMVGGPRPESLTAPIVQKEAVVAPSPFLQSNKPKEEPETGKSGMTVSEILEAEKKKSGILQEIPETKSEEAEEGGDEKEGEKPSQQVPAKAGFDRMFGRLFSHARTMPGGEIYEVSNKLENLFMNAEKMQIELEHQRDANREAKEREGRTLESIGELRSLVFQNESAIKEKASMQEKLEAMVKDMDPSRIAMQLKRREDETSELQMKLEKLEKVNVDLVGRIRSFQTKIESLGDIDSMISTLHGIDEKLRRIEKLKSDTERFSGKAESFYVESDKRLSELLGLKERLVQLEELSNEITRTLDETRLNVNACAKREDIENLKMELNRRNVPMTSPVSDDTMKREIGAVENQLDELRRQVQLLTTTAELRESVRTFKGAVEEKHREAPPRISDSTITTTQPEAGAQPAAGKKAVTDVETSSQSEAETRVVNPKIAGIRSAMLVLDARYRKGAISKKTYDELKSINERLIVKLETQPEEPAKKPESKAPEKDEKKHARRQQPGHPTNRHKTGAPTPADVDSTGEAPHDESMKEGGEEPARQAKKEDGEEGEQVVMVGIRPFKGGRRAPHPLEAKTDEEQQEEKKQEEKEQQE